ncbi:universal stress protein [Paraburkholderia sp. CNPSo 3281]|uniref:universal stress protein n=1 Tax=Paraburkholderia sp. CNPSo 3281 TaxID=2940933 RepID=UPI0020B7A930|nr:universal stress protein [Paraburkholderia sp. CNPSo 3281]MCP3715405.1 universal stress protein [Paraburkholderia sp. CNPSo 3281]
MHDVLAGYDGSASAQEAIRFAKNLAEKEGARLHILMVARPPDWGKLAYEVPELLETEKRHCQDLITELKGKLGLPGVTVQYEVIVGHPAKELVLYAERHNIDHVVVGHRGRTTFDRWLLGSIARQVIAYAPCSVTIVRDRPDVAKEHR